LVFDRKTGGLKKEKDRKQLYEDMRAAEDMREFLFNRKIELFNDLKDGQPF